MALLPSWLALQRFCRKKTNESRQWLFLVMSQICCLFVCGVPETIYTRLTRVMHWAYNERMHDASWRTDVWLYISVANSWVRSVRSKPFLLPTLESVEPTCAWLPPPLFDWPDKFRPRCIRPEPLGAYASRRTSAISTLPWIPMPHTEQLCSPGGCYIYTAHL